MRAASTVVLVLAMGCSGKSVPMAAGADAATPRDDGATPVADAARRDGSVTPPSDGGVRVEGACRVERRFVVHSGAADSYVARIAVRGNEVGVAYHEESPRTLYVGRFSLGDAVPTVADIAPLGEIPVIEDTGLVADADGFEIAWTDFAPDPSPRMYVTRYAGGALGGTTTLPGTAGAANVAAGLTESGRSIVVWTQQLSPGTTWELRSSSSDDGTTFGPSRVVSSGLDMPWKPSVTAAPGGGVAVVWVDRRSSPNHSALRFARIADDGTPGPVAAIVEHDRYVYETSIAFGAGRFLIATTDSRTDILRVPLYVTLLDPDGTAVREGVRLTTDFQHEHSGVAFDGAAFGVISVPFMDMGATNEQQVFIRRLDRDGAPVFAPPLQVSAAAIRESSCCIRANGARIVATTPGHYLVAWNQHEQRGPRLVFVITVATLDCTAP